MIGQQDLLLSSGSGLLILDQSSSIDIPDISPLKSTPSRVVINENLNQISLFESFNTEDDFKLSKTRRKPGSLRRHPYQGNPSQFIPSFKKDSRSSQNLLPPKPPPTFSNRIFEDSLDRDKSILSTSAISSEAESDTPQKPVFNKSATPKIDQTTPTQLRPWQRDFKKKQAKVQFSIPISYLWDRTESDIITPVAVAKAATLQYENETFSVNNDALTQLCISRDEILTVKFANSHVCYPYSFLKIILRSGGYYLIAISGSISRLQLPLKALRLSPANLGEVDYASALQLVEVARTKYSGKLPSSPHSVVAITYYSIAYLWEICEGLENLIPSLNLKIYCSNREVKISEDCSNTFISSMRFDEIKTLFHQSESERYPFTILKIVMNTGRSYTVCCDGGMIPFLGELVKVKIVSLQEEEVSAIYDKIDVLKAKESVDVGKKGILKM